MDTSPGAWIRGALVVALVLDVVGQLAGVVPSGSVGMAASVGVAGTVAVLAWLGVRWVRHPGTPSP
jgi:hypothetical protein